MIEPYPISLSYPILSLYPLSYSISLSPILFYLSNPYPSILYISLSSISLSPYILSPIPFLLSPIPYPLSPFLSLSLYESYPLCPFPDPPGIPRPIPPVSLALSPRYPSPYPPYPLSPKLSPFLKISTHSLTHSFHSDKALPWRGRAGVSLLLLAPY